MGRSGSPVSSVRHINDIVGGDSQDTIRLLREKEQSRDTKPRYSPSLRYANVEIIGESWESCVSYAKRITGINRTLGAGARQGLNTYTPQIGAIGIERQYIHAFVVESVSESGVVATEANFVRGKIDRRFIPYSDILGYTI